MKILVSWSSGKDSAWMLHVIRRSGLGTPAALLTTVNEAADRVAMHAVRRDVLDAQAAAACLPLIVVPYFCLGIVFASRVPGNEVIGTRIGDAERASVFSVALSLVALGQAGVPLAAGFLADGLGVRRTLLVITLAGAGAAALCRWVPLRDESELSPSR